MNSTTAIYAPTSQQQILDLFQALPLKEKEEVLNLLAANVAPDTSPPSPLERVLQAQPNRPVVTDFSLFEADLWADEGEFADFLAWQAAEREISKQLSEERFQQIRGRCVDSHHGRVLQSPTSDPQSERFHGRG